MAYARRIFGFPDPVNEVAARFVAAGVAGMAATLLLTHAWWLLWPLAYGFVARVLAGPRFSPLGQVAVRVVAPRLPAKPVPGPPKRFAQGIGAVVTTSALVAHYAMGYDTLVLVLLAAMVVFASLEAALAFCVGCKIFAVMVRTGWLQEGACLECQLPKSPDAVSATP